MGASLLCRPIKLLRFTQVSYLDLIDTVHENVVRLDISVHDLVTVQTLDSFNNLTKDNPDHLFRKPSFSLLQSHKVFEVNAAFFHENDEKVVFPERFDALDDIWMIKLLHDLSFSLSFFNLIWNHVVQIM